MRLSPVYEPNKHEDEIYALWEKSRAFEPKNRGNDESFSMVMPPPNANANIHIGTAITLDLEDIAVRYNRMKGKATLFVPGADHAGFETQAVYEKHLAKQGKSRFDYSRDELYQQIRKFVDENKKQYETQFRKLGASADWSRYVYTLDDKIVNRAYATFKKMWDDGLIYRGERLVNFCTFHGTAFADIEVAYKEEKGKMYYIHFPLVPVEGVDDRKNYILIATTRPETMLGDVAVAVHPDDKCFKHLIGRTVKIPLAEREVPIIADPMVNTEFGTGAVKITAAHDPNDFDVARNHNLPLLRVITETGEIGHDAPHKYHGMEVLEARKQVISELDSLGLLEKTEDHTHRVGHCYKCDTVIQPLVREQWFVDMKPLAKHALKALKDNQITFYPAQKQDQLISYLEGLKDWNISRQIAWGIPIPAFQNIDDPDDWIFDTRVDNELLEINGKTYRRDPDVFDTWFSSSSWPYATLDYPDGKDFDSFYPLSLMETGGEILYPWVSRMIMLGLYVTGKVPFRAVYIHGYVMAEDGSKMSKSLGNVVDPLPVIEQYGSDALRMGLIAGRTPAVNRGYDPSKIEGARNFCNKLWNIARFIEGKVGENYKPVPAKPETPADHWVLSVLQHSTEKMSAYLDDYRFAEGYELLYHTIWNDVADWYIEASKGQKNSGMLAYVLETILKLAHPYAPFVTETIWQKLGWRKNTILAVEAWPKTITGNSAKASQFESIKEVVTELRTLTQKLKIQKPSVVTEGSNILTEQVDLIMQLARIDSISTTSNPAGVRMLSTHGWLEVDAKKIDAYVAEINVKQAHLQKLIEGYQKRLSNKSYVANAPEHVVQETRDQLATAEADLKLLQAEQKRFA